MDIICALTGKHFSSVEDARYCAKHCQQCHDRKQEELHWIPTKNIPQFSPAKGTKLSPRDWEELTKLIRQQEEIAVPRTNKVFAPSKFVGKSKMQSINRPANRNGSDTPKWMLALLLIFGTSIIGLGISNYVNTYTPLYTLLCFSLTYSAEKWASNTTRRHKQIGILYKLFLNLLLLSLLSYTILLCAKLFSQQHNYNPLVDSLVFLAEFILFIWIWRVVSRNSWRFPSMKLTVFSLICLLIVFAYAGVEPASSYKNKFIGKLSEQASPKPEENKLSKDTAVVTPNIKIVVPVAPTPNIRVITPTPVPIPVLALDETKFNSKTGQYQNYYLGLVKGNEGFYITGTDCYGEFIVLINNKNAKDPTYIELLNFLKQDNTDKFPYKLTFLVSGFFYPPAEDKIDLIFLKEVIDETLEPKEPSVCADFAERLHNNAEKAGIKAGYVSLDMDDGIGHACNMFKTTDRGIIYIDVTGSTWGGPIDSDCIVDIQIGRQYNPKFIFPSGGWSVVNGVMGIVTDIVVTWDGEWRK